MRWTILSALVISNTLALCTAIQGAQAQGGPAKPPKKSFSNNKPKSVVEAPMRHVSDEDLADAVLGDSMSRLWVQSDAHFHNGEYSHAENLNRIIVQGDPHNMEAYATSAWLLWSDKHFAEAEALLKDGIVANPDTYYMYQEMGIYWLLERRDAKTAIPFYEKAVKFDCPFTNWNSLANCYEKTNQWDKAVTAWAKATLYPGNAVAAVRLKRARAALNKDKPGN